mmetsp:Transcript_20198/g.44945  ORF Transcript_20198/g.44945 Transcript_20198/m.44945 type:complete len:211 (-) Transcript_20198:825-1457(-)
MLFEILECDLLVLLLSIPSNNTPNVSDGQNSKGTFFQSSCRSFRLDITMIISVQEHVFAKVPSRSNDTDFTTILGPNRYLAAANNIESSMCCLTFSEEDCTFLEYLFRNEGGQTTVLSIGEVRLINGYSAKNSLAPGSENDILPLTKHSGKGFLAHAQKLCLLHGNSIGTERFILHNRPISKALTYPKLHIVIFASSVFNVGGLDFAFFD